MSHFTPPQNVHMRVAFCSRRRCCRPAAAISIMHEKSAHADFFFNPETFLPSLCSFYSLKMLALNGERNSWNCQRLLLLPFRLFFIFFLEKSANFTSRQKIESNWSVRSRARWEFSHGPSQAHRSSQCEHFKAQKISFWECKMWGRHGEAFFLTHTRTRKTRREFSI